MRAAPPWSCAVVEPRLWIPWCASLQIVQPVSELVSLFEARRRGGGGGGGGGGGRPHTRAEVDNGGGAGVGELK
jgi:hypothetical protein